MPVAIVTASDSGIGEATAIALARAGYDVGITWHSDEDGARDTAREVEAAGRRADVRRLDLSKLPDAAEIVDELAFDDWQHTLDVNLSGAFLCAQRAARRMVQQRRGGRIVYVTSVHEHMPLGDSVAYVSAKHGLGGMTKQLALELAEHRITVNAVAPGEIATPMTGNEDVDPRGIERQGIPLGRPGDANEVAALIVHLCSDAAEYITGASLVIDGGLLLMAAVRND